MFSFSENVLHSALVGSNPTALPMLVYDVEFLFNDLKWL